MQQNPVVVMDLPQERGMDGEKGPFLNAQVDPSEGPSVRVCSGGG